MQSSPPSGKVPKGPGIPGFIWQIQSFFSILDTMEAWHHEFGDIFKLPNDQHDFYCVASPSGLETVFKAASSTLSSNQSGGIFDNLIGANALVTLEGRQHQRHKRLMMPPFHGAALKDWVSRIYKTTQHILLQQRWGRIPLRPLIKEISLKVLLDVIFGDRTRLKEQLCEQLSGMFDGVESPLTAAGLVLQINMWGLGPWADFSRRKQVIHSLLLKEMQTCRSQGEPPLKDIFSILLHAQDEDGSPLSDAELLDELLTLCFAGYETTTSAIIWMLYWVYSRRDVEERIRAELNQVESVEQDLLLTLGQCPYLGAVCKESLRIYPVAIGSFTRKVIEPFEIDGYCIPAGSFIHPSIYLAHRRSSAYPDPSLFKPERFLGREFSNYEYLPFGGGNRRCVGAEFAQLQMKVVTIAFLQTVKVSLDAGNFWGGDIKPVRYGMTMAPPAIKALIQKQYV